MSQTIPLRSEGPLMLERPRPDRLPFTELVDRVITESSMTLAEVARGVDQAAARDGVRLATTKQQVWRWRRGPGVPSAPTVRWLAGALGREVPDFALAAAEQRALLGGPTDYVAAERTVRGAEAEAASLLEVGEGTADRRTAIKAITVVGGLGALAARRLLADAADAAVTSSRKRARVDPMRLEEFDQNVERFALDCLSMPHAELFPQVWSDWQDVERLLDARQSLKDRAHLTLLGGQLAYFLARLSFNLGDYAAARRHAVLAWEYAEDVGQPLLCASVRTLQGTIAFYAGQPHRSLELLQAAEAYDSPYCRSRIAANMARAYAVLGDRSRAGRALAAMERHLADLPVQPGDAPYTTATAMSALASTLARVGDGEAAEGYARQAVALHNRPDLKDTLFEDRGNATLNLAGALLHRRQPEPVEAARLGIEALAVPEAQRTETVRKRAVELCHLLGSWPKLPAVKDFDERLRDYELPVSAA